MNHFMKRTICFLLALMLAATGLPAQALGQTVEEESTPPSFTDVLEPLESEPPEQAALPENTALGNADEDALYATEQSSLPPEFSGAVQLVVGTAYLIPCQYSYYSFTAPESGLYVFENWGNTNISRFLGADDQQGQQWDSRYPSNNDSAIFSIEQGETAYFRLFSAEEQPVEITFQKHTPRDFSISSFEIKDATPTPDNPASYFERMVTVSATVPFGSSFELYLCYGPVQGSEVHRNYYITARDNSTIEEVSGDSTIGVCPGTEYWYEIHLKDRNAGEGGEYVSERKTFTVPPAPEEIFTALNLDTPSSITVEANTTKYFSFMPEQDGYYTISAEENPNLYAIELWDSAQQAWDCPAISERPFPVRAGTPQYIRINNSNGPEATWNVTVALFGLAVDKAAVATGEPQVSGFQIRIPVTGAVPLGDSRKIQGIGVEYRDTSWESGAGLPTITQGTNSTEFAAATLSLETLPGKTYQYRAFLELDDGARIVQSEEWLTVTALAEPHFDTSEFYFSQYRAFGETEWYLFPTPTSPALELTSGGGVEIDMRDKPQLAAYFVFTPQATGFYTVSAEGTATDTYNNPLGLLATHYGRHWTSYPFNSGESCSTTLYMKAGVTQYLRLDMCWMGEFCVRVSEANMPDLASGPQTITIENESSRETYFCFTPAESGYYQFTMKNGEAEVAEDQGNLDVWKAESENWISVLPSSFQYMEGGSTCYLRTHLWNPGTYTITASPYNSTVTEPSVCSEEAAVLHGFAAEIPVTVSLPLNCNAGGKIEYQYRVTGGSWNEVRQRSFGLQPNMETQTLPFVLDTFPGREYRYRAVLMKTDASNDVLCEETEWKTFTAGSSNAVPLVLDTPASGTPDKRGACYFSFTPSKTDFYQVSLAEQYAVNSVAVWNTAEGDGWVAKGQNPFRAEAGTTVYVRIQANPCTATVSKYVSKVDTFTVEKGGDPEIRPFQVSIPVKAKVPLGSSFRVDIMYSYELQNGQTGSGSMSGGYDNRFNYTNYEGEEVSERCIFSVLPNAAYRYRVFLAPTGESGSQPIYGEWETFQTDGFNTTPLELDIPAALGNSTYEQYFHFTPRETGRYQISLTGGGGVNILDEKTGHWTGGDSDTLVVSLEAGATFYILAYKNNSDSGSISLCVTKFQPTVTAFSVETGTPVERIKGFQAEVPITISAPIGSDFIVYLYYRASGSQRWQCAFQSGYTDSTSERLNISGRMLTAPGETYSYYIYLAKPGAGGGQIYQSEVMTYTASGDASAAVELKNGEPVTFQPDYYYGSYNILKFIPDETGWYRLSITGERGSVEIRGADGALLHSGYMNEAEYSAAIQFQAGSVQYLYLLAYSDSATRCTVKMEKAQQTIRKFEPPVVDTGNVRRESFKILVPVTAKVPLGSNFYLGVRYFVAAKGRSAQQPVGETGLRVLNCSEENVSETLTIPTVPGKEYAYEVFVRPYGTAGGTVSEFTADREEAATPPAEDVPVLDRTETETAPVIATGDDAHFTFTPQRTGCYRFSVSGAGGTLTVLRENGTMAASQEWSSDQEGEVDVHLSANETVYLTQTAQQTAMYSFAVEQKVLTVFDSEGNITVHLDAKSAGRYIFAVYDEDGKALKFLDRTVPEGETIQNIGQVRGADHVKVFCINEKYVPQGKAEEEQVTGVFSGYPQ